PLFTPTCYAYAVSQVLVQILGRAAICPIRRGLRYPILILEAIQQFGLKGLSANPTSFKILMKTAAGEDLDLTSLRYAMGGGQFLARQVVDDMQQCFPNSGVVNQYGCTENSPRISYHWVRDHEQPLTGKSLPVGRAVRGTELMVADEQANPVSEGEIGQVMIRGTSLMSRYWRMPGETKEKFIKGWLKTGDVGLLDSEQNLVLIGRMTDSINIGNEKVDPGEIEGYIQELPEIQEAAILGVEDPLLGEAVEAVVQVVEQNTLTESEVTLKCRSYLKELVSAYKIPRKIHLRQSLPRNLYGKLDRKRLREWIADPGK
ncbi:MAG: acyl--CoA ligase, partial [Candidatus Eisenbacteria bacterium]|nr:acyl--CoA ligase [Candidatus Eisenbacteria bacterium]